MTDKTFYDLMIGDWIADMHDGISKVAERFDIVSHVTWDEPPPAPLPGGRYVAHTFALYLQQFQNDRPYRQYVNKMIIVIGHAEHSTLSTPVLICGYSYDGSSCGIITLKDKA